MTPAEDLRGDEIERAILRCRELLEADQANEALREAAAYSEVVPRTADQFAQLCRLAIAAQRPTWIILFGQRYIASGGGDATVRMALAHRYRSAEMQTEAATEIEAILASAPTDTDLLRDAYDLTRSLRRPDLLVRLATWTSQLNAESLPDRARCAEAIGYRDGADAAAPLLKSLIETSSDNLRDRLLIADIAAELGLKKLAGSALHDCQSMVSDEDDHARFLFGALAGKLGDLNLMFAQLVILFDRKHYDSQWAWEHAFWRAERDCHLDMQRVSARRLIELKPSHVAAQKFITSDAERGSSRSKFALSATTFGTDQKRKSPRLIGWFRR